MFSRQLYIPPQDHRGSSYRIDFVLNLPGGVVLLEVDENQHRHSYYRDDFERMIRASTSLSNRFPEKRLKIYWLRYNPGKWSIDSKVQEVAPEERERRLVKWLEGFKALSHFHIGYCFYDMVKGQLLVFQRQGINEEDKQAMAENLEGLECTMQSADASK
jgi:hypothetical protein